MSHPIPKLIVGVFAIHAVSCAPLAPEHSVRFTSTNVPGESLVKINGHTIGTHKNVRGSGKICGHLNSTQTWLVVEDGCGGDSYPRPTVYRLIGDRLSVSVSFERIKKEHYLQYSLGKGLAEPVFLGFDPTGAPVINSATGKHTLSE